MNLPMSEQRQLALTLALQNVRAALDPADYDQLLAWLEYGALAHPQEQDASAARITVALFFDLYVAEIETTIWENGGRPIGIHIER